MFALPYASVATPAAMSTVTVPSALGVRVAVYVVPLPESDDVAPLSVNSLLTKLDVDSLKVIVTAMVELVAGSEAVEVIATVGPVPSSVQAKVLETVLLFPAPSVKVPAATSMVVAPSALGVKVAVYAVPEPSNEDKVPPETTTSSAANPVVDSLMVNVKPMLPSFVVEPDVTPLVLEAMVIVSAVESYVHAKVLDAVF